MKVTTVSYLKQSYFSVSLEISRVRLVSVNAEVIINSSLKIFYLRPATFKLFVNSSYLMEVF